MMVAGSQTGGGASPRGQYFRALFSADPVWHFDCLGPHLGTVVAQVLHRPFDCRFRTRRPGEPRPDPVGQLRDARVRDTVAERSTDEPRDDVGRVGRCGQQCDQRDHVTSFVRPLSHGRRRRVPEFRSVDMMCLMHTH